MAGQPTPSPVELARAIDTLVDAFGAVDDALVALVAVAYRIAAGGDPPSDDDDDDDDDDDTAPGAEPTERL
jgi:hypothetical protein